MLTRTVGIASEASATATTIAITGRSEGPKRTGIETAKTEFVVGDASPLEHLLGSLAACINVIGHLVAEERDIVVRNLDVRVEGDIDPAKYEGGETVEERCPVADNLDSGTDIHVGVERA